MTIYRLNRVPDKLHVDADGAARDPPRRPDRRATRGCASGSARRPTGRSTSPAATPRSARCAPRPRSRSSSRSTRTSRSRRPARPPTSSSAAASSPTSASSTARRKPQGADQLPFSGPPQVGDALYLGFEEAIGEADHAGRRWRPRWRAARASTPRTRRCAGRSPAGDGNWVDAEVLEDLTGGFNYGSGHRRAPVPAAQRRSSRSPASACTGCAAGSTRRRAAAPARPTRTRPRSTRSPRRRSARCSAPRTRRAPRASCSASRDGTPGQIVPAAQRAGAQAGPGETLEIQDPESGDWERWELRENFVGSTEFDRHFTSTSSRARSSSARRSARPTAAGRSTARCPPKGAVLRFTPLPLRRRARRQRRGARAQHRCAARSPASTRSPTREPAIGGVDAEPLEHARAARGDGDPDALPRGHRRGLRVPRRRGLAARRARGLPRAARRRGRSRCTSSRTSTRRTASCPTRSSCPTTSC